MSSLFSRAYVKAVAAQLGFRSSIPDVDDDSVDLILQGRGLSSGIRNPQIEVQLKCTSKNTGNNEHLKFVLPIKNYNDLRGDGVLCPRYQRFLFLEWVSSLFLSHSCPALC
ncbi:DUF4365 domain-containing protein [Agarivorans sp. QJM3NY_25]|uniref:DUF4365 domain-containing protein n=1 Tax=Agarivorans sp. QJM3NY_25 TaxID=3421430 RepID=UPI003D7CCB4C